MSKILKRTGAAFPIGDTGETVPQDGQLTIDPANYILYSRSTLSRDSSRFYLSLITM